MEPRASGQAQEGAGRRRAETRLERLALRWSGLATLLALLAFLTWVRSTRGPSGLWELAGYAGISLALLGKFVVFASLHEDAPGPWTLGVLVWFLDLGFAFALTSGLSRLERAPLLGRGLRRARQRARRTTQEYPRLQRMAFLGVMLYVFLPLAATGAITGSIVARLFGLTRIASVLAIALGSGLTVLLFSALADLGGARAETLLKSPLLAGASLLVLVAVGWRLYRLFLARLR